MLISGSPVLESLTVNNVNLENLKVCSPSLLTFTYVVEEGFTTVVIDSPMLEYLRLSDQGTESFLIENHGSLVKADIDTAFGFFIEDEFDPDDLPKRHRIRNFLVGISCVIDMIISSSTLEVIYDYSRCEKLPLFRNISFLRVEFTDDRWEMLPIFLESFTNLKSLVLEFCTCPDEEGVGILPGP
ncbi:PREDICTED: FBD-associated F-box protein At4g13985-like, partial [Camelina sativa]